MPGTLKFSESKREIEEHKQLPSEFGKKVND
jgi:hypothetical protein